MHVLLGLHYLIQDDILMFHPFACKIHDVFAFNSCIVFHCIEVPHTFSLFFSWWTSRLLPNSELDKAIINIVAQESFWDVGATFGYKPKHGIAVCRGRNISSSVRSYQVDFQFGCTSLYSKQQWSSVSLAPYPPQHVLPLKCLLLPILMGVKWNLRVILIDIFLMT